MSVEDLDDHRPHIMIPGKKNAHVIPRSCIEDVISGKKDITDIEEFEDFLPMILQEWLDGFK